MSERLINRVAEQAAVDKLIVDAKANRGTQSLIEVKGPTGSGKTAFIGSIALQCAAHEVGYYHDEYVATGNTEPLEQEISHGEGPLAVTMEWDKLGKGEFHTAQRSLGEVVKREYSRRLLVVVSTPFTQDITSPLLMRKGRKISLDPLNKRSALALLQGFDPNMDRDIQKKLVNWVGGYPLGLRTLAEAIVAEKLDPRVATDIPRLLEVVKNLVESRILNPAVHLDEEERLRARTLLGLFAIPRELNCALVEDMVKEFAPQYSLASSVGYLNTPDWISYVAPGMLVGGVAGGFSISDFLRPILNAEVFLTNRDQWVAMHKFAAAWNRRIAKLPFTAEHEREEYRREARYHTDQVRRVQSE